MKIIFNYIKNKKKLNIIRHNKKIQNKLIILGKDFEVYKVLKELIKEFWLDFDDIDNNTLFITFKSKKVILKYFSNFQFKGLKELFYQIIIYQIY